MEAKNIIKIYWYYLSIFFFRHWVKILIYFGVSVLLCVARTFFVVVGRTQENMADKAKPSDLFCKHFLDVSDEPIIREKYSFSGNKIFSSSSNTKTQIFWDYESVASTKTFASATREIYNDDFFFKNVGFLYCVCGNWIEKAVGEKLGWSQEKTNIQKRIFFFEYVDSYLIPYYIQRCIEDKETQQLEQKKTEVIFLSFSYFFFESGKKYCDTLGITENSSLKWFFNFLSVLLNTEEKKRVKIMGGARTFIRELDGTNSFENFFSLLKRKKLDVEKLFLEVITDEFLEEKIWYDSDLKNILNVAELRKTSINNLYLFYRFNFFPGDFCLFFSPKEKSFNEKYIYFSKLDSSEKNECIKIIEDSRASADVFLFTSRNILNFLWGASLNMYFSGFVIPLLVSTLLVFFFCDTLVADDVLILTFCKGVDRKEILIAKYLNLFTISFCISFVYLVLAFLTFLCLGFTPNWFMILFMTFGLLIFAPLFFAVFSSVFSFFYYHKINWLITLFRTFISYFPIVSIIILAVSMLGVEAGGLEIGFFSSVLSCINSVFDNVFLSFPLLFSVGVLFTFFLCRLYTRRDF